MKKKTNSIIYTVIILIIDIIVYGLLFILPSLYMSEEITYMIYFLLICPIICYFTSIFNIFLKATKILNIITMILIFSSVILTMYSEMIFVCLFEYILIEIYVYISMKYLLEKAVNKEVENLI